MRDTFPQRLAHRTALAVKRANGVVAQKCAILPRKAVIRAQLPDQRQRIAQTSREHKLCRFAALDARPDELDQTQDIDVEIMFPEQLLYALELPGGERERRWR